MQLHQTSKNNTYQGIQVTFPPKTRDSDPLLAKFNTKSSVIMVNTQSLWRDSITMARDYIAVNSFQQSTKTKLYMEIIADSLKTGSADPTIWLETSRFQGTLGISRV